VTHRFCFRKKRSIFGKKNGKNRKKRKKRR